MTVTADTSRRVRPPASIAGLLPCCSLAPGKASNPGWNSTIGLPGTCWPRSPSGARRGQRPESAKSASGWSKIAGDSSPTCSRAPNTPPTPTARSATSRPCTPTRNCSSRPPRSPQRFETKNHPPSIHRRRERRSTGLLGAFPGSKPGGSVRHRVTRSPRYPAIPSPGRPFNFTAQTCYNWGDAGHPAKPLGTTGFRSGRRHSSPFPTESKT